MISDGFIFKELKLSPFIPLKTAYQLINEKWQQEDKAIFHAITLALCPTGCLWVFEEEPT